MFPYRDSSSTGGTSPAKSITVCRSGRTGSYLHQGEAVVALAMGREDLLSQEVIEAVLLRGENTGSNEVRVIRMHCWS